EQTEEGDHTLLVHTARSRQFTEEFGDVLGSREIVRRFALSNLIEEFSDIGTRQGYPSVEPGENLIGIDIGHELVHEYPGVPASRNGREHPPRCPGRLAVVTCAHRGSPGSACHSTAGALSSANSHARTWSVTALRRSSLIVSR